jgi:hypothetical protein
MKCLSGTDAGLEVTFKASTDGGRQGAGDLFEQVRDRFNARRDNGDKYVPIVELERGGYQHPQYGWTVTPKPRVVDWVTMDGAESVPEPAPPPPPSPSPSPTEQPRRRRSVG